jgi:hypothetical protein
MPMGCDRERLRQLFHPFPRFTLVQADDSCEPSVRLDNESTDVRCEQVSVDQVVWVQIVHSWSDW